MKGPGLLAFAMELEIDPGRLAVNQAWRASVVTPSGGKSRPIVRKSGRYRAARAQFGEAAMLVAAEQGLTPLEGPLSVTVKAFWPRRHREGAAAGQALGDADAPLKGVLDALEDAGIFADDAQVEEVTGRKAVDAQRPRVLVWVYQLR